MRNASANPTMNTAIILGPKNTNSVRQNGGRSTTFCISQNRSISLLQFFRSPSKLVYIVCLVYTTPFFEHLEEYVARLTPKTIPWKKAMLNALNAGMAKLVTQGPKKSTVAFTRLGQSWHPSIRFISSQARHEASRKTTQTGVMSIRKFFVNL